MNDREKALACLDAIFPASLSYDDWLRVGMALKTAGCSVHEWDSWSSRDHKRYQPKTCEQKWASFRPTGKPVTVATLVDLCKKNGTVPDGIWDGEGRSHSKGRALEWDDVLGAGKAEHNPADRRWLQTDELPQPAKDFDKTDFVAYLKAVFEPDDLVGLSIRAFNKDGRWIPDRGLCDRTQAELIARMEKFGNFSEAVGDPTDAGAWIRINPLDGKGFRDENVTRFRHALLEADEDDLPTQLAIIREMNLPLSAIVHSGGKSIHAIVRVDAKNIEQYRERVDFLFRMAEKFGLKADTGNRNPSRLTRLPGVYRRPQENDAQREQYMISGPCGPSTWNDWADAVEDTFDDLPDPTTLSTALANPPPLSPLLIENVLRRGHKMVLTGPSKAAKSFTLIRLSVCIAEGLPWLGWNCTQGRVLYVNLELDEPSCIQRFSEVYRCLEIEPKNSNAIDVWNLRGQAVPLDQLAGKLIRRAKKRGYSAVILDPIYKVAVGDENDAHDMGVFCNLIDRIAGQLSVAVIYAHHHSKGAQGQKRAIDRASGSGVVARDADALVDLVELAVEKQRREVFVKTKAAEAMLAALRIAKPFALSPEQEADFAGKPDDLMLEVTTDHPEALEAVREASALAYERFAKATAWRVETVLREFAPRQPSAVWFTYPLHTEDEADILKDAKAEGEEPAWKREKAEKEKLKKDASENYVKNIIAAFEKLGGDGQATAQTIADEIGSTGNTVKKYEKKAGIERRKGGLYWKAKAE